MKNESGFSGSVSSFLSWLLILVLIIQVNSFAQLRPNGRISGRVLSADSLAASNINIILKGTKRGTVTDENGRYNFDHLPAGNYELQASFAGLRETIIPVTLAEAQQLELTDILLTENRKELEEIVVVGAARKFAKKQSAYVARIPISNLENPQVYTVVPKELFQEQIAVDFRSAITAAPGLSNITQSVGSGGVGLSLRMRGFSGASAAGSIRNGMNTNWVTMSDPVNLESIEVIKGPAATLFGSALITYGGLVNRVTKKPFDYFKGEAGYTTGSWALSRATIDINSPLNEEKTILMRVNAAVDNQKTFTDYGRSNTTVITPSLTFKVNDRLVFDLEAELYKGRRNATYIGLGSPNTVTAKSFDDLNFDFKRSYTTDDFLCESKNTNVFAKATYKLSEKWTSTTLFSNAYTDNNANYNFLNIITDSTMRRDLMTINSIFKTSQLQQNFNGDINIGKVRNRILIGIDYTYISTNDNRWSVNAYDTVKINRQAAFLNKEKYTQRIAAMPNPTVANNRDLRTLSAYVSDVVNITGSLIAMASVRVDRVKDRIADYEQTAVSPKFGLIYQVVKGKVSLFANYMNGFANLAPRVTAESPTEKVDFKPEQANQLEGGIKLELLGGKLNGTISYYDIEVKDKIRANPDAPAFSIQDGTQRSKGFEADLIANPVKGLHIIFGYGYNESKYVRVNKNLEGKRPASTPSNVANCWISYKLMDGKAKGLGFGIGGNTVSDSYLNDANTFTANGYTVADATVFYDRPAFRIGVKLNNLTNEKYWSADYWANQMPTRQLVANLTLRF